jgi:sensor c-di-GMP phosphodiesterase-like protein
MDDFGTGYSSLSYLREIPVDELKIDKSFISTLTDTHQALLVKTIIDISKNLNLSIVAEGVEEEYQKEFLADLKCDLYQGYLFSKSVSKEEFEKML